MLAGSLTAAALAAIVLRARSNVYRRMVSAEAAEADHDGTPDLYEAER